MSVAAQRPLNWNVMTVSTTATSQIAWASSAASDYAAKKGGKVVALTVPMSFGVRLSFRSAASCSTPCPSGRASCCCHRDEKMQLFRDQSARDALNELAQQPDNPMQTLANWGNKIIFDVVAPENEQYRGRLVGDIAKEQGRDAWDVLCDIAVADELNTSFGSSDAARDRPRTGRPA